MIHEIENEKVLVAGSEFNLLKAEVLHGSEWVSGRVIQDENGKLFGCIVDSTEDDKRAFGAPDLNKCFYAIEQIIYYRVVVMFHEDHDTCSYNLLDDSGCREITVK